MFEKFVGKYRIVFSFIGLELFATVQLPGEVFGQSVPKVVHEDLGDGAVERCVQWITAQEEE